MRPAGTVGILNEGKTPRISCSCSQKQAPRDGDIVCALFQAPRYFFRISISLRSRFVGLPTPRGRNPNRPSCSCFSFSYSPGGVISSAKSTTSRAATRFTIGTITRRVRVTGGMLTVMISPAWISRDGLTAASPILTFPDLQACVAMLRVL